MWFKRGYFAPSLVMTWAAASIAAVPMAAADPTAGNQSAAAIIKDLEAKGYTVEINGSITAPLERCFVNAIHNPQLSGVRADQPTTVYVDVSCPPELDPEVGFGFGLGLGF
jgi:hypothetical protein